MTVTAETLYSGLGAGIFIVFVAVTVFGALMASTSVRLIRSVSGLALSFGGLAGLYYFLNSPFLALMQILIYVGAVCVAIMFAMMLAELHETPRSMTRAILVGVASLIAALALAIPLVRLVGSQGWGPSLARSGGGTIKDLGVALLNRYGFAFELISVVLLLAILGALVVARSGRGRKS